MPASSNPVLCGSIAGRPGRFGVAMHNAAYRALGLDYVYVAFGTEDTAGAAAAMRTLGLRGLGVTMPHKLRIAEYLDAMDDDARAIGAVNTVVNDAGRLTGYNVDWIGAVRAFREALDVSAARVAVIGAGGGARAIVYGLVREGAHVTLYNRRRGSGASARRAVRGRLSAGRRRRWRPPRTVRPDRSRHPGRLSRSERHAAADHGAAAGDGGVRRRAHADPNASSAGSKRHRLPYHPRRAHAVAPGGRPI